MPVGKRGPIPRRLFEEIVKALTDRNDPAVQRVWRDAGEALLAEVRKSYALRSTGAADPATGIRWKPTRRFREGRGPIGIDSGTLLDSLRVEAGPNGVRLFIEPSSDAARYAKFFAEGTKHMPARPIFPVNGQLPTPWLRALISALDEGYRRLLQRRLAGKVRLTR
jgi:hypothetical protein